MKNIYKLFVTVSLGLLIQIQPASADVPSIERLSVKWWQWALAIPAATNPLTDTTGDYCAAGQQGQVWYLAGSFFGGTAHRSCFIPKGKTILVPVYNSVNIDTPNVCGQGPDPIPVSDYRAANADSVLGASHFCS